MIASSSVGLSRALSQNNEDPPPPLMLMYATRGVVGFAAVPEQQVEAQMEPQATCCHSGLCQLCHGSSTGEFFSFRV